MTVLKKQPNKPQVDRERSVFDVFSGQATTPDNEEEVHAAAPARRTTARRKQIGATSTTAPDVPVAADGRGYMAAVQAALADLVTVEEAVRWMEAPLSSLDGKSPREVIRSGGGAWIVRLLNRLEIGLPS